MTNWVAKWPEEVGSFWFYGWEFGEDPDEEPKLVPIEIWGPVNNSKGGKSWMYSARSHFIYPEQAVGLWSPIEMPELPDFTPEATKDD